jgi:dCMP deaminase
MEAAKKRSSSTTAKPKVVKKGKAKPGRPPGSPNKLKERLTRHEMFVEILEIVKKRSTCNRNQVAALITKENRIISMGYGGSPSGAPHCTDVGCLMGPTGGCIRTIHAEANCIAFSARHGIQVEGATMYTSLAPCLDCAKLIVNSGIKQVIFLKPYRLTNGVDLLKSVSISVYQYEKKTKRLRRA